MAVGLDSWMGRGVLKILAALVWLLVLVKRLLTSEVFWRSSSIKWTLEIVMGEGPSCGGPDSLVFLLSLGESGEGCGGLTGTD